VFLILGCYSHAYVRVDRLRSCRSVVFMLQDHPSLVQWKRYLTVCGLGGDPKYVRRTLSTRRAYTIITRHGHHGAGVSQVRGL
jgi:hypothetical protein